MHFARKTSKNRRSGDYPANSESSPDNRGFFTAKSKKRRLVHPLSMTYKSRLDYNNQELGTTKKITRETVQLSRSL
jgi:hypothetical protein